MGILELLSAQFVSPETDRGVIVQGGFSSKMGIYGLAYCVNAYGNEGLSIASLYLAVSPTRLKLELTESTLVEDIDATVAQMSALKKQGFKLPIDDLGTGYSSLAYLQKFPIDELKIDKSFVDNMLDHKVGTGIVDTIIALADHLRFEGVESIEQVNIFAEREITAMQGYYFARPMPADEFSRWLAQRR